MLRKLDKEADCVVLPRALASRILRHMFATSVFPEQRKHLEDGNDGEYFRWTAAPEGDDSRPEAAEMVIQWIEVCLQRPAAALQSDQEPQIAAG